VSPFGLFKKKTDEVSSAEEWLQMPAGEELTIAQAQDLLERMESARVKGLSVSLIEIKQSALQSLNVLDALAKDMDKENIKLEELELRLKSVVEHSRRTVVSSLKREVSLELPNPQTANDVKKFKDRFEGMMKRLGEVSGSHSKVLNAFMKKHSSKMKEEFERLTKLLNETRAIIAEFDQNREPIITCQSLLNSALQKSSSIKVTESSANNIEAEIEKIKTELESLEHRVRVLVESKQHEQASTNIRLLTEAEKKKEEFEERIMDLFSHLSRAFTRYSYGITKETDRRLRVLSGEPWQILYEENSAPYSSILMQIRQAIAGGQIQLKDSDKVLQYLDTVLQSLPELQAKARKIKSEIDSLQNIDVQIYYQVRDLEATIMQYTEELERNRLDLEQRRRQAKERAEEVNAILKQAGEILFQLTSKNYSLRYE
jgi:cell division septum initiation protein DivIVA